MKMTDLIVLAVTALLLSAVQEPLMRSVHPLPSAKGSHVLTAGR